MKIDLFDGDNRNTSVNIYVDDIIILQAISSNKGIVRIKIDSGAGSAIQKAIKSGKSIKCSYP